MGFHLASLLFSYFQSKCHLWSLQTKQKSLFFSLCPRIISYSVLSLSFHLDSDRDRGPHCAKSADPAELVQFIHSFYSHSYSNRILSQFYIYLAAACSVVMSQYDLLCLSQLWPQHQRGNVLKNYEGIFVLKGVSDSTRYLAENSALERKFNIFLSFEIFP